MRRGENSVLHVAGKGLACFLLVALFAGWIEGQQGPQQEPQPPRAATLRVASELVLVNVTARDRKGALVRDLHREDFTVLEDNKPQQILTFDLENTDEAPAPGVEQAEILTNAKPASAPEKPATEKRAAPAPDFGRNRRLVVLFFDLSAMQPDEINRSVTAAANYVKKQMSAADVVAIVSLGSSLQVVQDFTSDRGLLKKALDALNPTSGQGFEEGATGATEGTPDTGQAFTPDETEYNIFNTDRRLEALRSIAASLAPIDRKKSLIYFSSGMDRTGIENESELRVAINEAVRSNLAIYTMDIRGLQAMVPGGEAQQASLRGVAPYSGKATLNQYNSNFTTQETLVTLAKDTGGRAFLDSNDFSQVFTRVQEDTSAYYVLGYRSSNPVRDGRFRRMAVRVNRPGLKLDFRRGYYAPADFKHATRDERERQLEDEMASELPSTDLPVYLAAGYFRLRDMRFFVPVSLVVPGSAIPFTQSNDRDRATLDVLGSLFDDANRPLGRIRDTVKLSLAEAEEVRRKNVQYNTGFVLPPGKYHLKFVVRENGGGRLGSFETDFVVPELKSASLKMSSVVLSTQTQALPKPRSENPLVRDGVELVPNVTHVFSTGQHLYFFYEVYDPARAAAGSGSRPPHAGGRTVHVLSNVLFFRGKVKEYESPLVEATELNAPERNATEFRLDIPLERLPPGFYTCQVNVIDDAAGHFLFPRLGLLIRP